MNDRKIRRIEVEKKQDKNHTVHIYIYIGHSEEKREQFGWHANPHTHTYRIVAHFDVKCG